MKTTRRQRTARKLILPIVALVMMTAAMYAGSQDAAASTAPVAAPR